VSSGHALAVAGQRSQIEGHLCSSMCPGSAIRAADNLTAKSLLRLYS